MKVSALIPTFNRRAFIFRAIDSVLAQTVPVDEIIVVDDGSTDGTAQAIRGHYGPLVRVIEQKNMGVSAARKRAIDEARGEWVAFLDSDDEWMPARNDVFLKAIPSIPPEVAWIFGDSRYITDLGEGSTVFREAELLIDRDLQIFDDRLSDLVWNHGRTRPVVLPSSLIRRSVLVKLKCFADGLNGAEDFLAMLQIASQFFFAAVPSVVTKVYRTSDLDESSLERSCWSSGDHYRAGVLGCALAARALGINPWGTLHANSVRALCKWQAQNGLPIRRLACEQFKFGVSARSTGFFCAAMLGPSFFRVGFATKRKLKSLVRSGRSLFLDRNDLAT
jgi:glycosyltransferase involved in cell wall biosynthesis